MDRSWITLDDFKDDRYINGVKAFFAFAVEKTNNAKLMPCPCRKCLNMSKDLDHVTSARHIFRNGFYKRYTTWKYHGETDDHESEPRVPQPFRQAPEVEEHRMDAMLNEGFGIHEDMHSEDISENDVASFQKLLESIDQPLYPGSKYSKLTAVIELYNIKTMSSWTDESLKLLLAWLKRILPSGETLPESVYEMKKMIRMLGCGSKKIDVCPQHCMLYWGEENEKKEICSKCGTSRYKNGETPVNAASSSSAGPSTARVLSSRVPKKVMRWFPLIPRLKRLFMCKETSELMRWHGEERVKDGVLRHPADSEAWKHMNDRYPDFDTDCRNVRLGLASDGFNPYRTQSVTYSIWPVILSVYNLPPWLCMKKSYLTVSLLIPGPSSPGKDIDVFLQPLIHELQVLWKEGVRTYDALKNEHFLMRACLMWTINDFPAYAYLSGWPTQGKYACPCCNKSTNHQWLDKSRKMTYQGHRRFLPPNHRYAFFYPTPSLH